MTAGVVAIFGPTASGKSAVARAIAARIPAELVSADSMQVYSGVPILTNQSNDSTHLVGIWPLDHEASVAEYARLAHDAVDEISARGRTPIVVGGTGLYLRAALAELEIPPAPPPGLRERLVGLYDRLGPEGAHAALAERDPAAAAAVHPNDRRRVIRGLELSELGASLRPAEPRLWSEHSRRPTMVFGLDVAVEELHRRIEMRTRRMFELGVQDEARRALAGPISSTAQHIIGLQEVAERPREEAFELLTAATRRYAAYQRKWMRRIPGIVLLRGDQRPEQVAEEILATAIPTAVAREGVG